MPATCSAPWFAHAEMPSYRGWSYGNTAWSGAPTSALGVVIGLAGALALSPVLLGLTVRRIAA